MKTNPEINALKHRIRELEETVVYYQARDDRSTNLLKHLTDAMDEFEEPV